MGKNIYTQLVPHEPKHCIYCCGNECECEQIQNWGPDQWYGNDDILTRRKYLSLRGKLGYIINEHIKHVCRIPYRRILEFKNSQMCALRNSCTSSCWKMLWTVQKNYDAFSQELKSIHFFDWTCNHCCSCYSKDTLLTQTGKQSQNPITSCRSDILLGMSDTLKSDLIVLTKKIMSEFRAKLSSLNVGKESHRILSIALTKYISVITQDDYKTYVCTADL